jgi:tetratricopeptide (TPR) repeat protein
LKDYREQQTRTGDSISEGDMNQLGYVLLRLKKPDDAIEVFTQNTEDHPESWNVWDSLAEAYADKGNKDLAIKYYEKSLQLNPDNTNGANQIKKLKTGS